MTKIAVLVSGGGTNLQALMDAQASGLIRSAELTLVVSNRRDAYALERAKNHGVETAVLSRRKKADRAAFEDRLSETLAAHGIEMIILAGFMVILSEKFVKQYPRRMLNVHPSLIPSFCGAGYYGLRVHEAALERGVKVTGATVHYVNEIPDGGEIIAQKAVAVEAGDTPEPLQRRVMAQAAWIPLHRAAALAAPSTAEDREP
mgnify:CR=1 FL=1